MNKEDIIRMAREANIKQAIETPHLLMVHELERFASLVAAAEREACAQVAMLKSINGIETAAAIRARGEATLREQV